MTITENLKVVDLRAMTSAPYNSGGTRNWDGIQLVIQCPPPNLRPEDESGGHLATPLGELLINFQNGRFYMREGKFISAPPEYVVPQLNQNYLAPSGSQWTIKANEAVRQEVATIRSAPRPGSQAGLGGQRSNRLCTPVIWR
ncbi:MAG TPA: hypothetical protein VN843_09265 [Anaerolineales bacterium]|nr:hypothetical protein [Anaerolineales bacterium]